MKRKSLRSLTKLAQNAKKRESDVDERIVLRGYGLAFWAHADVRVARAAGCSVGKVLEHGLERGARLAQRVAVDRVRTARAGRLDQGLRKRKKIHGGVGDKNDGGGEKRCASQKHGLVPIQLSNNANPRGFRRTRGAAQQQCWWERKAFAWQGRVVP